MSLEAGKDAACGTPLPVVIAFLVAVFLIALAPIVVAPILPTIDFYDHVSRYFVLAHIGESPFLQSNYQEKWSLLPNIGLDVIGTPVVGVIGALVGAKVVAVLVFATQYFGLLFFNFALTRRFNWIVAILAVPLLYSFILTWGFANFLLGLGLVFWGAGLWLLLRHRLLLAAGVGVVSALVVFVTHGVAFVLYGVLLGGIELGFLLARANSLGRCCAAAVALAVQAVAPAMIFLLSATAKAPQGLTNATSAVERLKEQGRLVGRLLEIAQYRLVTIFRVAEGPSPWFDLMSFVATGALLLWLAKRGRVAISPFVWPALTIGALLTLCVPPALFGVGYVADRIPLFVAFLGVASLSVTPGFARPERLAVGVICALVAVRLALVAGDWASYRPDLAAYNRVGAALPPGQIVAFVNVDLGVREDHSRRCEMYGPLLASTRGQAAALFAIPSAQPLELKGRLALALSELPGHSRFKGDEARAYYSATLTAMAAQKRFDYVLVCNALGLQAKLPPGLDVVAEDGRFTLAKVARSPSGPAPALRAK